jgi:hypothetical protein
MRARGGHDEGTHGGDAAGAQRGHGLRRGRGCGGAARARAAARRGVGTGARAAAACLWRQRRGV